jgi:simple sugar transport system permease protein
MHLYRNHLVVLASIAASILLAAVLTSILVSFFGESPLTVARVLLQGALGSAQGLSSTLFYATPLFLTGTAVLIPLRAGYFNIGAEGQLYIGSLFVALWCHFIGSHLLNTLPNSQSGNSAFVVTTVLAGSFLAASLGGALWATLAAWLKTRRGVHEVLGTIMLNFIAYAVCNWFILNTLKNPHSQATESAPIAASLQLGKLWHDTPVTTPLLVFVGAVVVWALGYTWWGYRVRATGHNANAARLAGIAVGPVSISAMALGGALAGLVGFHEIHGHAYRFIDGYSPQYGFTGIAVALLSRGKFMGLLLSALLFGALHRGALELDLETENITRDLAAIIQANILVCMALAPQFENLLNKLPLSLPKNKGTARG